MINTDKTFLDTMIRLYGLNKLNSLTKYPSILTYHELGERGKLKETLSEGKSFGYNESEIFVTEKIDGTNSRIVLFTDEKGNLTDFLIGSREDFLFAKGDRIINPTLGIVDTVNENVVKKIKENVSTNIFRPNHIYVIFGETYGGKINAAKNYTMKSNNNVGFRMFDVMEMSCVNAFCILDKTIEKISSWREQGCQHFIPVNELINFSDKLQIERVPYIKVTQGKELPTDIKDTFNWLQSFSRTNAILDTDYTGPGKAEGVVIRTRNRELIRKIRFEDYERTLR